MVGSIHAVTQKEDFEDDTCGSKKKYQEVDRILHNSDGSTQLNVCMEAISVMNV